MMGLTHLQKRCLDFIRDWLAANGGVAPSYEEIRSHLNLGSKSSVYRVILELEDRNQLVRHPGAHRALELVNTPDPIDAAREALTRVGAKPTMANIARVATALTEARNAA